MFRKVLTFVMLIIIMIGLVVGIYFFFTTNVNSDVDNNVNFAIFETVQTKPFEVNEFFTYGKCFNFSGILPGISEDNFESAKLYLTNGNGYEKTYKLNSELRDGKLVISTTDVINNGLLLDDLEKGEYVVLVRLKLNNNINAKYYSLSNQSTYPNIEYYTVTKDGNNRKIDIQFKNTKYKNDEYSYLSINVENSELPENIYDIVIDAGHGGTDSGEKLGSDTEANITLIYSKLLKEKLEEKGLKVKLTRDDQNSQNFTTTNMYDENGRITSACSTKAKYMLSLHINNGNKGLKGLEIYSPSKSDLTLAQNMANKIVTSTSIDYSNNNSFKQGEGVYVRNFTKSVINDYTNTANRKGYEPYNITLDTPYLYTIREVGGIATNAYVDGRNKAYSANKYYNSNQGIECYQIEMGYIKSDLDIIKNEIEQYVTAIAEAFVENM